MGTVEPWRPHLVPSHAGSVTFEIDPDLLIAKLLLIAPVFFWLDLGGENFAVEPLKWNAVSLETKTFPLISWHNNTKKPVWVSQKRVLGATVK